MFTVLTEYLLLVSKYLNLYWGWVKVGLESETNNKHIIIYLKISTCEKTKQSKWDNECHSLCWEGRMISHLGSYSEKKKHILAET
jgi:hypothetical protein